MGLWERGNFGSQKVRSVINGTIFKCFASNLDCTHDFWVSPPDKQERPIWGKMCPFWGNDPFWGNIFLPKFYFFLNFIYSNFFLPQIFFCYPNFFLPKFFFFRFSLWHFFFFFFFANFFFNIISQEIQVNVSCMFDSWYKDDVCCMLQHVLYYLKYRNSQVILRYVACCNTNFTSLIYTNTISQKRRNVSNQCLAKPAAGRGYKNFYANFSRTILPSTH